MSGSLFRREAVEAATSRYGNPVRPIGLASWALTIFLVALLASVTVFMFVGRYARKETVTGVLQPSAGSARIAAVYDGVVAEVYVNEGTLVRAGDPILRISTDRSVVTSSLGPTNLSELVEEGARREALAMARQANAQASIDANSLEDLHARQTGLEADQKELAESLQLQNERVRLARETLEAGRALHERQLFSLLQLRQREEALIAAQQSAGSIERELRRNDAALRQMRSEEGRLRAQVDQARGEVEQSQAQFDQRQSQRLAEQSLILTAGVSGRVVSLQARLGGSVQPGRALAVIVPQGKPLQAELWAPSRAAGFITQGDRVRLMYDAFPYQKFGVGHGRVSSVSGAPVDPQDLAVPIESREALYRIVVNLDEDSVAEYGKRWPLTPGMRLSADLVLDERNLWEWLLEPVIAANRRR